MNANDVMLSIRFVTLGESGRFIKFIVTSRGPRGPFFREKRLFQLFMGRHPLL